MFFLILPDFVEQNLAQYFKLDYESSQFSVVDL
jgi:hypothetical protein